MSAARDYVSKCRYLNVEQRTLLEECPVEECPVEECPGMYCSKLQRKGFVVAKFVSETWQPKTSVQKWGVQTRELSLLLGHSEL